MRRRDHNRIGKQNIRFWYYCDGWGRITMRPSQTLTHVHGGATDEGYYVEETTFEFDGELVTVTCETDARDCDGRISRTHVMECDVDHIADEFNEWGKVWQPRWMPRDSYQRDYAAEAMGY